MCVASVPPEFNFRFSVCRQIKTKQENPTILLLDDFPSVLLQVKNTFCILSLLQRSCCCCCCCCRKKLTVANKQQYILSTSVWNLNKMFQQGIVLCVHSHVIPAKETGSSGNACIAQKEKETLGNVTFISLLQWGLLPHERLTQEPLVSH